MRIAFVSYEFPPETGGGGIGTYLVQVTGALARLGHDVHVFAGSTGTASATLLPDGVHLHRVPTASSPDFRNDAVRPFLTEHRKQPFDVIEGTDFDASALEIKRTLPGLAYVVKLHTPRFVIDELHWKPPSPWQKLRMSFGAWRRGQRLHATPIKEQPAAQLELAALRLAEKIAMPSQTIARTALQWTPLEPDQISVFPLPYEPDPEFLKIPSPGTTNRITYLGRLEERKGVIDLVDSIPLVLSRNQLARFRFVGRSMPFGHAGRSMQDFLTQRLGRHAYSVEFIGPRPPEDIPRILSETDILIAPSHWESFGLVCCEGLAAARAVIGSANGGMVEILDHGACGLLLPPHCPKKLADGILRLLARPDERQQLGEAGRRHMLKNYSLEAIIPAQLACYEAAIAQCRTTRFTTP